MCFREHMLPAEDVLTTDVRTNRHRNKTRKETNIHLEIIPENHRTILHYQQQMLTNKTVPDKLTFRRGHSNNLPTDF